MKTSFLALLLIIGWLAHGNDSLQTKSPRKITKGGVVAYSLSKVRDQGHSPLLYRGPELYLRQFRERHRSTMNTRIELDLGIGLLTVTKKQTYFRTQIASFRADLNYHFLFNLSDSTRKISWQIGPMIGNVIDNRYYMFLPNNAYSYQYTNYLGISAAAKKSTSWKGKRLIELNWRGHMAIFARDTRPNYIGMEPAATYEGDNISIFPLLFKENKMVAINKFFLLRSEFSTDFARPGKKSIRLFYAWTFSFDVSSNPMVLAKHHVGFGKVISQSRSKKKITLPWRRKKTASLNPNYSASKTQHINLNNSFDYSSNYSFSNIQMRNPS